MRFPYGIRAVADYVHSVGLRFGLYSSQTQFTCQDRPGSYTFETVDVDTYCAWGIDYLKVGKGAPSNHTTDAMCFSLARWYVQVDNCGGAKHSVLNESWVLFRSGIDACTASGGRSMVFSVESCGTMNPGDCHTWIPKLANLWRTTGDIQATWASVMSNLDNNNVMAPIAGPGHWNDPDMLQVRAGTIGRLKGTMHLNGIAGRESWPL